MLGELTKFTNKIAAWALVLVASCHGAQVNPIIESLKLFQFSQCWSKPIRTLTKIVVDNWFACVHEGLC